MISDSSRPDSSPPTAVSLSGLDPVSGAAPAPQSNDPRLADMVWIPGGRFEMGSESGAPDEYPVHEVELDGFWMDRHEVTNRQFREFVEATGYVTTAEQPRNCGASNPVQGLRMPRFWKSSITRGQSVACH